MKILGKNGKLYYTMSKEDYNEWRKKHRARRRKDNICQDCPNDCAVSLRYRGRVIARCEKCAHRFNNALRRKRNAKRTGQNDSSRNSSNSQ